MERTRGSGMEWNLTSSYPEMSNQKLQVINSRFVNQRIFFHRHVWGT